MRTHSTLEPAASSVHGPLPWPGTRRAAALRRRARRLGLALRWGLRLLLPLVLLWAVLFTWAWNVAPATSGLMSWVQAQDSARHAPYTSIGQVSPLVTKALVAIEDERFYQHHGIDTIGLARAAYDDLRAGRMVEGGSTLTAQLAKNAYLAGNDRTPRRKLEDLLLALKVEHTYSKSQILEMYLNLVYFGDGAYGIGAAAQRYFHTTPAKLDLAQSALLAGLVQAPGAYDPYCHPSLARARQRAVLDRMVADGMISAAQRTAALRESLPTAASATAGGYCG